jgi:glyoxylase-like metal-dependent hydrolase (beta-lactamase superfamily II)/rhodanese-related sulfurtransferase
MLVRQVINEDLGCASYLVACGGEAAVIDPQYEIEPYLELAALHGLRITRVLETHDHADHVSGHGRLADATGATIHAPAGSGATYPHETVADGDVIAFGNARIHVLATPGHRPEHVAYGIEDLGRGEGIAAIASGDSLLVGDVARPDLAVDPGEGGPALHDSIARLLDLGDHVEVLPGHIGGSLCGSDRMSGRTTSTIGYERRMQPLLSVTDPSTFTDELLEGLKARPPHVDHVVARNRGALHAHVATPVPLSIDDVVGLIRSDGAAIVDLRDEDAQHDAHIPGSASVPMTETGIGTRTSTQVDPRRPVVLLLDDAADAERVAMRLGSVGIDDVRGWIDGGFAAWREAGLPVARTRSMHVSEFAQLVRDGIPDDLVVVDVRDPSEWRQGVLGGSQLTSLASIAAGGFDASELAGRRVALICLSGSRAGQAAALLERAGVTGMLHVAGGGVLDLPGLGVALAEPAAVARA